MRGKPKIYLSQQHASLPGASWKGMVPYILSAVSSPGASWKVTVPLILSASYNTTNPTQQGIFNMYNTYTQTIKIQAMC